MQCSSSRDTAVSLVQASTESLSPPRVLHGTGVARLEAAEELHGVSAQCEREHGQLPATELGQQRDQGRLAGSAGPSEDHGPPVPHAASQALCLARQ